MARFCASHEEGDYDALHTAHSFGKMTSWYHLGNDSTQDA